MRLSPRVLVVSAIALGVSLFICDTFGQQLGLPAIPRRQHSLLVGVGAVVATTGLVTGHIGMYFRTARRVEAARLAGEHAGRTTGRNERARSAP